MKEKWIGEPVTFGEHEALRTAFHEFKQNAKDINKAYLVALFAMFVWMLLHG